MRIGNQDPSFAGLPKGLQKCFSLWSKTNQMRDFTLEHRDIELQRFTPVIQAIPINRPFDTLHVLHELLARLWQLEGVLLGIAQRQVLQPEMIIKIQVEQGAIHIQQYSFDFVPSYHHLPSAKPNHGALILAAPASPCTIALAP